MILVSQGTAISVGAHVDWQYKQKVAAAKQQARAVSAAMYGTAADAE
jgi:hypothetical protein